MQNQQILRALELYSHNLKYMLNDEGVDTEARQNKIAMLKYTYEVILVNKAEQVNNKTNEEDSSNTFANNMLKKNNVLEIIPNNKKLQVI